MIELQHALAIDFEMDNGNIPRVFEDESKSEIELIVSVCCGLVTIDQSIAEEESQVIRLVHYTTQEYLSQIREKWFPEAEERITNVCAAYISFDVFESGVLQFEANVSDQEQCERLDKRLQSNPFYAYASMKWGHHARESNTSSQIIRDFLADDNKVQAAAQAMFRTDYREFLGREPEGNKVTVLVLISIFGAIRLAQELLDTPTTRFEDSLDTALVCAAFGGYTNLVELLLDKGADPNTEVSGGDTVIAFTTRYGYVDIVRALLRYGADPNKRRQYDNEWTALFEAISNDHLTITELLLENGADYTLGSWGLEVTAIDEVIERGHKPMVQLFLDKITHPKEKATELRRMMLDSAVQNQKIEFAQMVFEKDPGLNLRGEFGTALLIQAVEDGQGNRQIIELLLEKGAGPKRNDTDRRERLLAEAEDIDKEWLAQKLDFYLNTA